MAKESSGILFYRSTPSGLEFLLVHPGGPFWSKKDLGAWTIPKGEVNENETPFHAAIREVKEELGFDVKGKCIELTSIKQKGGKTVHAWALQTEFDVAKFRSNIVEIEWPPKSGRKQSFPEIDKAEWFDVETGSTKINPAQIAFLHELISILDGPA